MKHFPAVQHERGPRKPKMHSSIHNNGSQHHHQAHLQMSFTSVSAYAPHLRSSHQQHHHSNFHHHATPIHHPQPMPFPPMVHANHHITAPQRLDHNKMSAFDFPNHTNDMNHYKSNHHLSPSPTQTIKSGSSIEPSSEGMSSPQLIVDSETTSPMMMYNNHDVNGNGVKRHQSLVGAQRSGLLDILMNPDKCQVCDGSVDVIVFSYKNFYFPSTGVYPISGPQFHAFPDSYAEQCSS